MSNDVIVLGTPKSLFAQCQSLGLKLFLIKGRGDRHCLACWPTGLKGLPRELRNLMVRDQDKLIADIKRGVGT